MNTLIRKQFNLDNFYNFMMNSPKYKDVNVLEVFGDIKRVLHFYNEEEGDKYTEELRSLLVDSNASETIKIIVDFLRDIDRTRKYFYLPVFEEMVDFVNKSFEKAINLGKTTNSKGMEFKAIHGLCEVFTLVDWLRGPTACYWILSETPLDFMDVIFLCHLLTKKDIEDPSIALQYEIA